MADHDITDSDNQEPTSDDTEAQSIFDLFEPPPERDAGSFGKVPVVRGEDKDFDRKAGTTAAERKTAADAQAAGLQDWRAPATGQIPAILVGDDEGQWGDVEGPSWNGGEATWTGPDLADVFAESDTANIAERPRPAIFDRESTRAGSTPANSERGVPDGRDTQALDAAKRSERLRHESAMSDFFEPDIESLDTPASDAPAAAKAPIADPLPPTKSDAPTDTPEMLEKRRQAAAAARKRTLPSTGGDRTRPAAAVEGARAERAQTRSAPDTSSPKVSGAASSPPPVRARTAPVPPVRGRTPRLERFERFESDEDPTDSVGGSPAPSPGSGPQSRTNPTERTANPALRSTSRQAPAQGPKVQPVRPIDEDPTAPAVFDESQPRIQKLRREQHSEGPLSTEQQNQPTLQQESSQEFFDDGGVAYDDPGEEKGGRNLPQAIGAGLGLGILVLAGLWLGPNYLILLVAIVALLAVVEFYNSMRVAGLRPATLLGLLGTVAVPLAAYYRADASFTLIVALSIVFGALWYLAGADTERPVLNLSLTILGIFWIGGLAAFAAMILRTDVGVQLLLTTILITVVSDTFAYFGGRTYGSRPFHQVSPNKTWEGTLTGFAAAVLTGLVIAVLPIETMWSDSFRAAVLLGIVVGVLAPIGDLAESMVKRDLGVKDMGTLIPGHGGVLDRIDALLFALPGAYYVALTFGLF